MDDSYVATFITLLWGMALGAVVTMSMLSTFCLIRRRRKFASLNRSSIDVIDDALTVPIKDYVWELHEECLKAKRGLEILPLRAAAESERSINKYWEESIDKLMSISSFATEKALHQHGLTREHPCQVMRPKQV